MDLPLINLGSKQKPNYVPAELCEIVQGIAFRGKLSENQTSNMLNLACRSPQQNSALIRGEGFAKLAISSSDPCEVMQNFGITIDSNMTVVPARILPPPRISYGQGRSPQIFDGSWNLKDVKFSRGGSLGRFVTLVLFEGPIPPSGPDPKIRILVNTFKQACTTAGMSVDPEDALHIPISVVPRDKDDRSRSATISRIKEKMAFYASRNPIPSLILVLLPKYDAVLYAGIKRLGDVECGLHTACMLLDKATNERKQLQYLANVALKVNVKMNGINHKLDDKSLAWLRERKTLVLGADVTHRRCSKPIFLWFVTHITLQLAQRACQVPHPWQLWLAVSIPTFFNSQLV